VCIPAILNTIIDAGWDEIHWAASKVGRLVSRDISFKSETREYIEWVICPTINEILETGIKIDLWWESPYDQSAFLWRWQKWVSDCAIDVDVDNNNWMYWYPGDWIWERCAMTQEEVTGIINFDTPEWQEAMHDLGDIVSYLNRYSKIDRPTGICEPATRKSSRPRKNKN